VYIRCVELLLIMIYECYQFYVNSVILFRKLLDSGIYCIIIKIIDMKRNILRKIIGGISLTSVMFVFQACYGTPQDFGFDLLVQGQVKSKTSGLPIKGIKVSVVNNMQYEMTDEEGRFSFYTERFGSLKLRFQDIDSTENGLYINKDTILTDLDRNVYLAIDLEEK